MKRSLFCLLGAILTAQTPDVASFTWMTGCWEMRAGATIVEEQWSKPAGGGMQGISRTLKGGRNVFSEFMRIDQKNGRIVYMARIDGGAAPTPFTLIRGSAAEAVFENPAHDFPQRIIYRATPEGGLSARIEGVDKGKERHVEYPMKAVACR